MSDVPEGCKPFDLERALAGDPVVTRSGNPVTQLHKFELPEDPFQLSGVLNGAVQLWTKSGNYYRDDPFHPRDLFMAPKKIVVWINVYRGRSGQIYGSVDGMEQAANMSAIPNRLGNKAHRIEIEE